MCYIWTFETYLAQSNYTPSAIATPFPQAATMADQLAPTELRQRKQSVGTVELQGPGGVVKTVNLEELNEADRALAADFGYKPVFKREFGYLSSFSFAVSISGLFSTVATTFSYPLYAGGSASAVWCWLISGAGCMCIAVGDTGICAEVDCAGMWANGSSVLGLGTRLGVSNVRRTVSIRGFYVSGMRLTVCAGTTPSLVLLLSSGCLPSAGSQDG